MNKIKRETVTNGLFPKSSMMAQRAWQIDSQRTLHIRNVMEVIYTNIVEGIWPLWQLYL